MYWAWGAGSPEGSVKIYCLSLSEVELHTTFFNSLPVDHSVIVLEVESK